MDPIDYLKNWISTDLSHPQSTLNNLSACPFAKTALDSNKIEFYYATNSALPEVVDVETIDASVFIFDNDITPAALYDIAINFNKQNPQLVALEDHPLELETLDDIVFNNKKYPIIIIQSREKLEHYRKILRKTGYYEHWPADDLKDLLNR
jgi:hypothetical protein